MIYTTSEILRLVDVIEHENVMLKKNYYNSLSFHCRFYKATKTDYALKLLSEILLEKAEIVAKIKNNNKKLSRSYKILSQRLSIK